MIHHITLNDDRHYVLHGKPLLVSYDAGDYDFASPDLKKPLTCLHHALYDLYQWSDAVSDGDEFWLDGKMVFYAEFVHVKPAVHVAILMKYEKAA